MRGCWGAGHHSPAAADNNDNKTQDDGQCICGHPGSGPGTLCTPRSVGQLRCQPEFNSYVTQIYFNPMKTFLIPLWNVRCWRCKAVCCGVCDPVDLSHCHQPPCTRAQHLMLYAMFYPIISILHIRLRKNNIFLQHRKFLPTDAEPNICHLYYLLLIWRLKLSLVLFMCRQ